MRYVHGKCLERWLNESIRTKCELCSFEFSVIQTRRYTFCESLSEWQRRPGVRFNCQMDLISIIILTLLTLALSIMCYLSVKGLFTQGIRASIVMQWVKTVLIVLGVCTMIIYTGSVYFIISGIISPWYKWWQSCVNIKLMIDEFNQCEKHDILSLKDKNKEVVDIKCPENILTSSCFSHERQLSNNILQNNSSYHSSNQVFPDHQRDEKKGRDIKSDSLINQAAISDVSSGTLTLKPSDRKDLNC